tara:strand:+ start:15032 stop:15415 length:384 start_codon:yes stop_codon:yes gene_type:complete
MHLNDLFSKEVTIDFAKNLHISESKIKTYIHNWPDEIYEIIIMLQNENNPNHFIYHLPNGDGVLEFNLNPKTKKIDIIFHDKNNLKLHKKFKHLLGKIYEDILNEHLHLQTHSEPSIEDIDTFLRNN